MKSIFMYSKEVTDSEGPRWLTGVVVQMGTLPIGYWIPGGDAVWGGRGGVALLADVCHWTEALGV